MSKNADLVKQTAKKEANIKRFEEVNDFKMNHKNEIVFVYEAMRKNSYLGKAEPESVLVALHNVSVSGLTLNPMMQQAALVPRKENNKVIAYLEPMYQGMISLMVDTGQASSCHAEVVYENDYLDIDFGTGRYIKHRPYYLNGQKEPGEKIGAYAVAKLPEGEDKFEFLRMEYINQIRDRSDAYQADQKNSTKYSPWSNEFVDEMIKKTAIKALWKKMPKNKRAETFANIINMDDQANKIQVSGRTISTTSSGEDHTVQAQPTEPLTNVVDDMSMQMFVKTEKEKVAGGHIYSDDELMGFTDKQLQVIVNIVFNKESKDSGPENATFIKELQATDSDVEEAVVVEEKSEEKPFPQEDFDAIMEVVNRVGEPTIDPIKGKVKLRSVDGAKDIQDVLEDHSITDAMVQKATNLDMETACSTISVEKMAYFVTHLLK